MRPSRALWPLLLLLVPWPLAALQAPVLERAQDGLELSHLPAILSTQEVRRQLGTGLTTSIVFEAMARNSGGARVRGAARVDIRYELWDEVYIVTRIDAAGRAARLTLPSFQALSDWWRDARLVMLRPAAAAGIARNVQVRLRVIPFSQAEQLDAQRWFSQALSAEKSGSAGAVSEAVENQPESFSQVLNLLMATSIGRPALLEYDWKLAILPGKTKR